MPPVVRVPGRVVRVWARVGPGLRFLAARRTTLAAVVVAAGLPIGVWSVFLEPGMLRNETYELAVPRWPAACAGVRIAVLADLHVGSPFNGLDKLDRIIALANRAHPDVMVLPGDFVSTSVIGGRFVPPGEIVARLARLSARHGVYAVMGNHDWWYDAGSVHHAFERRPDGPKLLEDAAVPIVRGACRFWIVGISDFWEGRHDVRHAIASVPDGEPIVAFTHNPDIFPRLPRRLNLTIAGHTHGGQVWLPVIGRPGVPSRYGQRYAIGHIVENRRHLFVSSGLGTSIIPVRFLVPPEVSVIDLVPAVTPRRMRTAGRTRLPGVESPW